MKLLGIKSHPDVAFPSVESPGLPLGLRYRLRWRTPVDDAKSVQAIWDRTQVPILAFVGANGGGKSLCAVYTVLPVLRGLWWECANPDHLHTHGDECAARRWLSSEPTETCTCDTEWITDDDGRSVVTVLADGAVVAGWRRVLSTVALRDPDDIRRSSPHFTRLRSFTQLLGVEHADVLLDEVTGVASSRQSQSLPVQVENLIQQLRRRDARLMWTTPDYGNADVRIRSVTKGVVYCTGGETVVSRNSGSQWRESRLFQWTLYDAMAFDKFTLGKREKLDPISRQFFWGPGHIARETYDTLAAVSQLGAAVDGGMCLSCGGTRSRAKCSCPPDPDRLPPGVSEVVTPAGVRRRTFSVETL